MDDKNESEKLMEELKRIGEGFNKFIESIGEALNELFYPKEDDWEMKCPYKEGDEHYCLQPSGDVFQNFWDGIEAGNKYFSQGNIFLTEQEAETEAKRRNLLRDSGYRSKSRSVGVIESLWMATSSSGGYR